MGGEGGGETMYRYPISSAFGGVCHVYGLALTELIGHWDNIRDGQRFVLGKQVCTAHVQVCPVGKRNLCSMVIRKTKKKEESTTLPTDMIFEILSRITLGDIGRCRLVSKDWNLITYDSSFIQAHCERTKTIDGFFIRSLEWSKHVNKFVSINEPDPKSKLSLDFIPGPVSIIAATKQGLLLCVDDYSFRNHKYYVCKPSTKQWRKIPNPRTRYFTERCAMVVLKSNPLHYKIIRFSTHSLRTIMTYKSMKYSFLFCEIFDSKAWAWKKLKDEVMLPKDEWLGFDPVVSASGSLYWLTNNNMVFIFHVDSNKWATFDLPFPLCKENYFDPMKLVEYQGRVGMLCKKGCDIQVWMMENHEVWSKKQTMSIEPAKLSTCCYPVAFQSSDIMLMRDDTNMIHYDFRSGNSKMSNVWTRPMEIFPFHSDFELVDLKNRCYKKKYVKVLVRLSRRFSRYLFKFFQ